MLPHARPRAGVAGATCLPVGTHLPDHPVRQRCPERHPGAGCHDRPTARGAGAGPAFARILPEVLALDRRRPAAGAAPPYPSRAWLILTAGVTSGRGRRGSWRRAADGGWRAAAPAARRRPPGVLLYIMHIIECMSCRWPRCGRMPSWPSPAARRVRRWTCGQLLRRSRSALRERACATSRVTSSTVAGPGLTTLAQPCTAYIGCGIKRSGSAKSTPPLRAANSSGP